MGIMAMHRRIAKDREKEGLPPKRYWIGRNKEQQAAYEKAKRENPLFREAEE